MAVFSEIRVFVAASDDVAAEGNRLEAVVEELNRTICPRLDVRLRLLRWQKDTVPEIGRPEGLILKQIGPYDVMIGIMWKKFGSPTGKTESGTKEEFDTAYDSWKLHGRPRIMFYFSQAPYVLRSVEEAEQLRAVLEFKSELKERALIAEYLSPEDFERKVREGLVNVIYSKKSEQAETSSIDMAWFNCRPHSRDSGQSSLDYQAVLKSVIHYAARLFEISLPDVLDRLVSREQLGSTGIGDGMAFPHTYGNTHDRHIILLVRSSVPIEWYSMDGEPVDTLAIMIFSHPRNAQTLRLLSLINRAIIQGVKKVTPRSTPLLVAELANILRHTLEEEKIYSITRAIELPDLSVEP